MLNLIYLFTCACAYVQSEDYYYDRIAINVYDHGYSMMLVDGVSEKDGKLLSCIDGKCHSLSIETTNNLKEQALAEATSEEPQYWYTEGLAAFLNEQSMLLQKRVSPLFKVTHSNGGASVEWESSDIYLKQVGNKVLVVGPKATYTLSNPHELLESTYQSGQYIQSSKVGRRYGQHGAVVGPQEDDASLGSIVSNIVFSQSI